MGPIKFPVKRPDTLFLISSGGLAGLLGTPQNPVGCEVFLIALNCDTTPRGFFIIVRAEAHNSMLLEHRDGAKPEVPHDVGLEDLSDGVSEGERVGSAVLSNRHLVRFRALVLILMALS